MTNERNCILRDVCKLAGHPDKCINICRHFIALHGESGKGGRVAAANIPKDYRRVTLATSPVGQEDEQKRKIYEDLRKYVRLSFPRQFDENGERIKSLFFYSAEPGTGKTTTAAALANEYIIYHYLGSKARNRRPEQRPVFFMDFNLWQSRFNEFNQSNIPPSVGEPASEEFYRLKKIAMSVPFLVIDDIGVRGASEAFRAQVHDVINRRVTERMPTIYTSNVPIAPLTQGGESLKRVYDPRIWDRVRDQCIVFNFDGDSKRGIRKDHD
jgi:DNA replication protein DnaC